jgi:hypothetical protein
MIMLSVTPPILRRARGDETLERVIVTFFAGPCGWPGMISIDRPVGSFSATGERISGPWGELPDAAHPYRTIATNGTGFFRAVFSP